MGAHDAELMQRWRRGERAAFEALVRRWQQPMAHFLFRLVGQEALVQDLCQEVFLRLFHAGPRYQESGTFSTWLYRIALNVARDAARRRRREPLSLVDAEVPDPSVSAEARCFQEELTGAVARAVADLPEPLRVALVLRHYEGMSFENIARLTGTPASTIKSRFTVALRHLRARLQELGWGPEDNDS